LPGVAGHHPGGQVIGCRGVWALGLVSAHVPLRHWWVSGWSASVPAGVSRRRPARTRMRTPLRSRPGVLESARQAPNPGYRPAGRHHGGQWDPALGHRPAVTRPGVAGQGPEGAARRRAGRQPGRRHPR
jgi:hypothetical protein